MRANGNAAALCQLAIAANSGQLGDRAAANESLHALLIQRLDIAKLPRQELAIWWQPDLVEDLIVGLRKAGLEPDGKLLARPCDPQAGSCILRDCTQIPSYCDYGVLNQSEAVRQRQSTNCVSDR